MDMEKRKKAKIVVSALAFFCVLNILICFFITKTVYDSIFGRYDPDPKDIPEEYSQIWKKAEKTSFLSGENRISALLFDSEGESVVIIVQGINSVMSDHLFEIDSFLSDGRDVFIFDPTGAGESEGESAVGFSQTLFDLDCAVDHVESRYGYTEIFLFGHSRGGYSAIGILSERDDIQAAVSVSAPNSPMEAVIGGATEKIGPLAYGNYPILYAYQAMLFDRDTVSLSCSEVLSKTEVPVLVVHGEYDTTVSIDKFCAYSYIGEEYGENIEFRSFKKGHTDILTDESLMDLADSFFDKAENTTGGE